MHRREQGTSRQQLNQRHLHRGSAHSSRNGYAHAEFKSTPDNADTLT